MQKTIIDKPKFCGYSITLQADGASSSAAASNRDADGRENEATKNGPSRTAGVGHHLHGAAAEREQAGTQAHPRGDRGADPAHQRQHLPAQAGAADGVQLRRKRSGADGDIP